MKIATSAIGYGMQTAAEDIVRGVAVKNGLGAYWDAFSRVYDASTAVQNYHQNATTLYSNLLNNFDTISSRDADALVDNFARTAQRDLVESLTRMVDQHGGVSDLMNAIRLTNTVYPSLGGTKNANITVDYVLDSPDSPLTQSEGYESVIILDGGASTKMTGSSKKDFIAGGGGDDVIHGYRGNDIINGGGGDDVLRPGEGDDWVRGGVGNDRIHIDTGVKMLDGGEGADTLYAPMPMRHYTLSSPSPVQSTIGFGINSTSLTSVERKVFADGEYTSDWLGVVAQIHRLYGAALDRKPDMGGLVNWKTAVESGALTLKQAAQGFLESAEAHLRYGVQDTVGFVNTLYRNVLHREADATGLSNWVTAVNAGMGRDEALVQFSESPENQGRSLQGMTYYGWWVRDDKAAEVARLYDSAFDSLPDAGGLAAWTDGHKAGMSLTGMAEGFIGSAEFQARYGALGNEAFVQQLYKNVLNRTADADGLRNWTTAIDAGMSKADMVVGFSESAEHVMQRAPYIDYGIWYL
ncbi:DUF4214 domain-containing protein [Skermanella stibiiresistens]|uniref:DUF4214 domain-containing protein n=1 Tax=Skermanella stibiiresistens TaxID=913326 RepID=UPI0004AF8A8D|nr:DUF4214 domain-containing protein [Skermanella stibiiresistens]